GSLAGQWVEGGHCEVMVVSLGAAGALLATKGRTVRIPAPYVRSISSVGAGDSMVAGIVWSLSLGRELKDAVEYGCACGAAATINPGTSLCYPADVDRLMGGNAVPSKVAAPVAGSDDLFPAALLKAK
ncbi:MAG: PfkB family carbohydrate kinase, partial [Bacteroidota bacterium]|nr:PfkB family carbohydrate kinase [Bacteroidota bacterium]